MRFIQMFRWLIAALSLALSLFAGAQIAASPFAGVSWQDPAGMKVSDSHHDCPSRCVVYEGRENQYPLLRVHEALVGNAPQTLKTLMAWMKNSRGESVTVVKNAFKEEVVKDGSNTVYFYFLERGDRPDDRSPDYSLFLLVEQGGVTLPLEQYGLSRKQMEDGIKGAIGFYNTVKLNPVAIKNDLTVRAQAFTQAAQALKNGYARGEKVKLYAWSESGVKNVYTTSGLQLRAFNNIGTLAFLPGGLFLKNAGDFQSPDWRTEGDGELPARWKKVGSGYQVTTPDGQTTTYAVEKASGNQTRIRAGSRTYWEISPLTKEDVIGVFSTKYSSSSGLAGTNSYSSGNIDVTLLPNGRYEDSGQSFTAVTSPNVTAGTGNNKTKSGKWSYDPASYTLTLSPDGGGSQRGLTYTQGFSASERQIKGGGSVDWLFMGRKGWWKSQ
ncbi:hypothetical protein [Deinococcus sp.]|uniref:hypothetical protein n=1 Tax=Deinococcus sp. TaxID=47478 RepID=UPI003B59BB48